MAKHAVLSPSSAKRWMSCPGSVALSEGLQDTSSTFAEEGTAAHFLASYCLVSGENAAAHLGRCILLLVHGLTGEHTELFECDTPDADESPYRTLSRFAVDGDMADNVQVYLDYVRDVQRATDGELLVEVSVPLDHITGEEGACGTSDAVIVTSDELIVIDLKFGRGVEVDATQNPQLLMYASGARKLFDIGANFTTVRVAISQPRITHAPSEWSCSSEDLDAFESEVLQASANASAMACGATPLAFEPSTEACRWCKAKAKCKALEDFVAEGIAADFDEVLTQGVALPAAADLSQKMMCLDLIEDWCKAVRGAVESELLHGRPVEGYKLVQGRQGARAWTAEEEAEAALKGLKVKAALMYKRKLISPTDAEKLLKGDVKWDKLQKYITRAEGRPSVAPASDKRPALVIEPTADDFDVV